jgi:hypothetical protein
MLLALLLMTSCIAGLSPSEPDLAWVILTVGADGAGAVDIHPSFAHEEQLMPIGRDVGHAIFPGREVQLRIDGNAGGADFVHLRVDDLYQSAPHPSIAFTTQELGPALIPYGITRIEFDVCLPDVDWSIQSKPRIFQPCEVRTPILLNAQRLDLTVDLRPSTRSSWPPQILIWTGVLALLIALISFRGRSRRRLRGRTIPFALLPIGLFVAAFVSQGSGLFASADDAGISGRWSGWFLNLAQADGLIAGLEFLAAITIVGVALSQLEQAKRRELFAGIPWRPDLRR